MSFSLHFPLLSKYSCSSPREKGLLAKACISPSVVVEGMKLFGDMLACSSQHSGYITCEFFSLLLEVDQILMFFTTRVSKVVVAKGFVSPFVVDVGLNLFLGCE